MVPAGTSPPGGVQRRARRRPPLPALFAGAAVVTLGGLALLEALLGTTQRGGPRAVLLIDDAACYYAFPPHLRETREKPGTPLRYTLATDARGFRRLDSVAAGDDAAPDGPPPDPDAAPPADAGPAACHVLYVGDSYVQGSWLDGPDTAPAQLARALERAGYGRARVHNGGVEGHTLAQARMSVLGRWRDLAGGTVVAQRTANDLTDLVALRRLGCAFDGPPPATLSPAVRGPLAGLALTEVAQDAAARLVSVSARLHAVESGQGTLASGHTPKSTAAECRQAADDYRALSLSLVSGVAAAGGHVLFVGAQELTCPTSDGPPFDDAAFQRAWAAAVRAAGAEVLEVPELLRAPGATLAPHDGHPSAAGNAALVARVADALARTRWLDGCR